ncbi:MAG TPA: diguanylate cyclase [Rhodocyclaceae bacterium]|nr:diguanylate cyclase [Rhodocyclaceae bacterium]
MIEDDVADATSLLHALLTSRGNAFDPEWVRSIAAARVRCARTSFDTVLLDLTLPDGSGIEAFRQISRAAPNAGIVVLCRAEGEIVARETIEQGASGYLIKGRDDPCSLRRLLHEAAARSFVSHEAQGLAQLTLNSIGDAVLTTDLEGRITYLNRSAEALTGWRTGEASGRPLAEVFRVVGSETRVAAKSCALRAIAENRTVSLASGNLLIRRDGIEVGIEDSAAPIRGAAGHVAGAVIVFRDVTAARENAQRMLYQAQHDFLTGLPNRELLSERLSQAIGLARRRGTQVALMFIDLDYFKNVNDTLGHSIGDSLLESVARRLVGCVRTTDTVARQGGDEFVVLLSEIETRRDAANVAEKILESFTLPHAIDTHTLHVTLSIGISLYPDDGTTADLLLHNADVAMYGAKGSGRNGCLFFASDMRNEPEGLNGE